MNFQVFIVHPILSKLATPNSIITLLEVTENYLKDDTDSNLKVIVKIYICEILLIR